MILALLLVLAAVPGGLEIMDEMVEVPAGESRAFDLELRQRAAVVDANFSVESGGSGVRVGLMRRADAERLRQGQSHRVLAATGYERAGHLRYSAAADDYSLVIDNRLEGRGPAKVRVRVALVFSGAQGDPKELSTARRAVVIALSILFFAGTVLFTAKKVLPVWNRRDSIG
jgi:hypothetical protein